MEVKKGYKKTEVGIIPEDWEVTNIIENSTLKARIGWQGLTTSEYLENGDYLLITGTDFNDGKIIWESCYYVKKSRYDQDKNIQIKDEDILITKDGTIGKVAFIKNLPLQATLNSGVFVIRPQNGSYVPQYMFYIFYSIFFKEFLRKLVAGSTINHLYQKDFISFSFPLPPKQEQAAIAQVLSDTDELISSLEKLIEKKKQIKQGVMQQLLTGKKRLPGFSGEWEVKSISEIFSFKQGVQCPVERQKSQPISGMLRFIRIVDLTQPGEEWRYIEDPGIAHHISFDDLFMVRYGTPGLLGFGFEGVIANNLFRLIPKIEVNTNYFFHLLSYHNNKILQLSSSTTMAALNFTSLKSFTLHFPRDLEEQSALAEQLNDMDLEINVLDQKLNKYKSIKQGMMENLLTGKIRLV